jgi:DNA-binding transcriptional MerR regulator
VSSAYRIHAFAELAGVTVKALHHYDRLGLLKPRRTDAGYRVYANADLERLEEIVALKSLGFSLKQVGAILDHGPITLPDALRLQRQAIENKQAHLSRALVAICAVEDAIESGKGVTASALRRLIEVLDVQHDIETMKRYYSKEGWETRRRYYEEGPSAEWQELYRDVRGLIGEDPGSEKAQAVADCWLALSLRAHRGDAEVQTDSMTAWADRANWPPVMKQRVAELRLEEVNEFIKQAAMSSPKRYFSEHAWVKYVALRSRSPEEVSRVWQARVDLFRDVEAVLGADPASDTAQALATRWRSLVDEASSADREVKAGLIKMWADRHRWSAGLRWQIEGLHMMGSERFEKAADFIDTALAVRMGGRDPQLQGS